MRSCCTPGRKSVIYVHSHFRSIRASHRAGAPTAQMENKGNHHFYKGLLNAGVMGLSGLSEDQPKKAPAIVIPKALGFSSHHKKLNDLTVDQLCFVLVALSIGLTKETMAELGGKCNSLLDRVRAGLNNRHSNKEVFKEKSEFLRNKKRQQKDAYKTRLLQVVNKITGLDVTLQFRERERETEERCRHSPRNGKTTGRPSERRSPVHTNFLFA